MYIYILPSGGLYATYHLLREPETTIEKKKKIHRPKNERLLTRKVVNGSMVSPVSKR